MTTIAAIQGDGFTVIGFDSQISSDDRVYFLPKTIKKISKNGKYLIGAAGDLRAINLLTDISLPDPENLSGIKLDKFVSTKVIPVIRGYFETNGYAKDGSQEFDIMLCVNGIVYEIADDYCWARDDAGIYGIGSGASFAIGALHSMIENGCTVDEAKAYLKQAITISSYLDSGTGGTIHIAVQYKED
jgi:ATP-dependent protease HslVU (ClpYQ) peptidase subunit